MCRKPDQTAQVGRLIWVFAWCTCDCVYVLFCCGLFSFHNRAVCLTCRWWSKQVEMQHNKTNKMTCAQRRHINLGIPPVWSVFSVRIKKHWVLCYQLSAKQRLRSDWADAQADLSLCWVHRSFRWFFHATAQFAFLEREPNIWTSRCFKICELQLDKSNKMMCAKRNLRSAWASAQSDQFLCAQWVAKNPRFFHADSEDWSEWADAQADLSLRWTHRSFCWFCRVAAHVLWGL